VGIIPTLAPYLLHCSYSGLEKKYPDVKLLVNEITRRTSSPAAGGEDRCGYTGDAVQEKGIREHVLFYEELVAYVSRKTDAFKKTYVLAKDIDPDKLWLLEEGHCFRSQIVNALRIAQGERGKRSF